MSNLNDLYTTLADLGHLSPKTYEHLPSVILDQLDRYELQEEKDVFISGALGVLSGCLPNVRGQYANEWYHPNLYVFVVAPAGGGKGPLTQASKLARPIHRKLKRDSKAARARWEERNDEEGSADDPKPPPIKLISPGNTSAAALIQTLDNNDGRALMIETEADTLSGTLEKEWGNFSDILRKAHPHEPVSSGRIEETKEVERPRLSVVLSGTPDQLPRLVGEVGNGLWSRLCLYGFIPTSEWKDVAPDYTNQDRTFDLNAGTEPAAKVRELYEVLARRSTPLNIRLRPSDWELLNDHGERLKNKVHQELGYAGDGIVHRMGVHIFRLASLLGVWNYWDRSEDLSDENRSTLEVPEKSFEAGLVLGWTFAHHNLSLVKALSNDSLGGEIKKLERMWLESLPDQFETATAVERAEELQISERTAKRRLSGWTDKGILEKLKQGLYEKATNTS